MPYHPDFRWHVKDIKRQIWCADPVQKTNQKPELQIPGYRK